MSNPEVTIIVAAFNEEETIENCLRRVSKVFPQKTEILVVDGGNDKTGQIVRGLEKEIPGLRYIHNDNDRGKGHAIRVGIENAKADIMTQVDADLQFMPEELPLLIEPIKEKKADVTLGTRFAKGSTRNPGSTPFFRTLGNKTASLYASILFCHRMTDVQAGMKAWTKEAIRPEDLKSDNYSYEVEIPIRALKKGLKVLDVPITTDARQGGETCVNVVTDGIALLIDITCFRIGIK